MVSIQTIAQGLSKQIENAIAGKADSAQAKVLCDSVDTLIKLARLQLEMAEIDWDLSSERPVIEMEKVTRATIPAVCESKEWSPAEIEAASDEELQAHIKLMEKELSHTENEQAKNENTPKYPILDKRCKALRKYLRDLRDNLEER